MIGDVFIMSTRSTNYEVFKDKEGILCAVRRDYTDYDGAKAVAKQLLVDSIRYGDFKDVKPCYDYTHMYFGFGYSDGESDNTWWLADSAVRNGSEVYVFRAVPIDCVETETT